MSKLILLLFTFLTAYSNIIAQEKKGAIKNLGPQIHSSTVQGSAFIDVNGENYLYTVVRGRPAHLAGFDLKTNKLITDLELEDTDGSWSITGSSDGILYIASAQGYLFKHKPGTNKVENLGRFENEKLIWDLVPGENGEIFGGTYPGCRVFRYHPKDGFSDISTGAAVTGEQYAQFLAFNKATKKLYVGVYFGANVVEINTITKEKKLLFNEEYKKNGSIYNLKLVDTKEGTKLLVWINHIGVGRETLMFNTNNLELEKVLGSMEVRQLLQSNKTKLNYFSIDNKLYSSNFSIESSKKPKLLANFKGKTKASKWLNKKELLLFTTEGELVKYHILTGKTNISYIKIPAQPIDIQSIFYGPDKKVWMGGYLAGGHAAYNPATQKTTEYTGLHQTEGMASLGDTIYFGIYGGAQIYSYNTKENWDLKSKNPKKIHAIADQSRPFANLSLDSLNKIYFFTVPNYGKLGGAITEYNATTNKWTTFSNVINNQSPVSILLRNGKIWGGTTVSGGLGIKPSESECKLFCFDPTTNKVIYENVPLPGNMGITALTNGPDGNIWGLSDGQLFIFDTKSKKVIYTQKIYDFNRQRTHLWIDGKLVNHPNGKIYGTGGNLLFEIDPQTKVITKIDEGGGLLSMDDKGVIYYRKNSNLFSFTPNQ